MGSIRIPNFPILCNAHFELRSNQHCSHVTLSSEKWALANPLFLDAEEEAHLPGARLGLLASLCFPTCDPGQLLAIMGASGAGKSTFLDILARKNKKGAAKRVESDDEELQIAQAKIDQAYKAAFEEGEQPKLDLTETVEEWEERTGRELTLDDIDLVVWGFFKWHDLGYDDGRFP